VTERAARKRQLLLQRDAVTRFLEREARNFRLGQQRLCSVIARF
jgi:hypothetical protein